ncbi:MAG: transposase [candidate division WOR-3 bacterium]
MKFYKTHHLPYEQRLQLVEEYLQKKESLRRLAISHGISHQTLYNWVKIYKKSGREKLKLDKRPKKSIENKIMFLKEQNPSLSIRKAKSLLNGGGVKISEKVIWRVWRSYGLINSKTQKKRGAFSLFVQSTTELENEIAKAKEFIERGDYKNAGKVLNDLPAIPESLLLKKIPEKFLSPRRRLERLYLELGEIPFPRFLRKVRTIRKTLESKGYIYSSLIADFLELDALGWLRKLQETEEVFVRLEKKMAGVRDRALWFLFYYDKAAVLCSILKMGEALKWVARCRKLIYSLSYPYYLEYYGDLLTRLGAYKKALSFYKRAYEKESEPKMKSRLALKMASLGYGMAGEYQECKKMLARVGELKKSVIFGPNYSLINAYLAFEQGDFDEASELFLESLRKSKEGELYNYLYATYVGLAGIAMALGNRKEAKSHLRKALKLMEKYHIHTHIWILKGLLGEIESIPAEFLKNVPLCLLNYMIRATRTEKITDYRRAYNFAQKKGILGIFRRWIIFFPAIILHLLEKGKKTFLAKSILKFPLFNSAMPVYYIKFLGSISVSKNQQFLRVNLSSKEYSFLIHFALRSGEPGKFIILREIYENFWPRSEKQVQRLLNLLVRLKKKLIIPGHLFGISSRDIESRLVNYGIYFATDYQEFNETLARAKALERAGEWGFARKEYLRAFRLFRGEPFKKNFDNWSVDMRFKILSQFETEAINFAKSCLEHGNKNDARKILQKVLKIIPDSEESQKLFETL